MNIEDAIRIIKGLDTSNSEENIEAKKMAIDSMRKGIPIKVRKATIYYTGEVPYCPRCRRIQERIQTDLKTYCCGCGQLLDWREGKKREVQTSEDV